MGLRQFGGGGRPGVLVQVHGDPVATLARALLVARRPTAARAPPVAIHGEGGCLDAGLPGRHGGCECPGYGRGEAAPQRTEGLSSHDLRTPRTTLGTDHRDGGRDAHSPGLDRILPTDATPANGRPRLPARQASRGRLVVFLFRLHGREDAAGSLVSGGVPTRHGPRPHLDVRGPPGSDADRRHPGHRVPGVISKLRVSLRPVSGPGGPGLALRTGRLGTSGRVGCPPGACGPGRRRRLDPPTRVVVLQRRRGRTGRRQVRAGGLEPRLGTGRPLPDAPSAEPTGVLRSDPVLLRRHRPVLLRGGGRPFPRGRPRTPSSPAAFSESCFHAYIAVSRSLEHGPWGRKATSTLCGRSSRWPGPTTTRSRSTAHPT